MSDEVRSRYPSQAGVAELRVVKVSSYPVLGIAGMLTTGCRYRNDNAAGCLYSPKLPMPHP